MCHAAAPTFLGDNMAAGAGLDGHEFTPPQAPFDPQDRGKGILRQGCKPPFLGFPQTPV